MKDRVFVRIISPAEQSRPHRESFKSSTYNLLIVEEKTFTAHLNENKQHLACINILISTLWKEK